jgi:hypothetical protein
MVKSFPVQYHHLLQISFSHFFFFFITFDINQMLLNNTTSASILSLNVEHDEAADIGHLREVNCMRRCSRTWFMECSYEHWQPVPVSVIFATSSTGLLPQPISHKSILSSRAQSGINYLWSRPEDKKKKKTESGVVVPDIFSFFIWIMDIKRSK